MGKEGAEGTNEMIALDRRRANGPTRLRALSTRVQSKSKFPHAVSASLMAVITSSPPKCIRRGQPSAVGGDEGAFIKPHLELGFGTSPRGELALARV